jgi:hypothetical protein
LADVASQGLVRTFLFAPTRLKAKRRRERKKKKAAEVV